MVETQRRLRWVARSAILSQKGGILGLEVLIIQSRNQSQKVKKTNEGKRSILLIVNTDSDFTVGSVNCRALQISSKLQKIL